MIPDLAHLAWDDGYARLPDTFHQRIVPTPLSRPALVAFNPDVAALLGLAPDAARDAAFAATLNGERPIPGATPIATIYAGYQFGVWVPQLGDGRAILLGEVAGTDHHRWEIQIKGAGPTRYSRMGDGRAVLRSCIREFLGGEAMHGLGIPTTRSLAIIGSETPVFRETTETGALLVRVAPTHVRFGTLELFASRGMTNEVEQLAHFVIDRYFPALLALPATDRLGAWFAEVAARTATLMAGWTATGFVHGVMNTDNMSILGLTLDYGPFAWMERYVRGFAPNHTDRAGRYAYDQQPAVGLWNCVRLAEALHGVVPDDALQNGIDRYQQAFEADLDRRMQAKLGLMHAHDGDVTLIGDLLALLEQQGADFTNFFRELSTHAPGQSHGPAMAAWFARYDERLRAERSDDATRTAAMQRVNPRYILRNWMAQEAIAEAQRGDFGRIDTLQRLLRTPYETQAGMERYAGPAPEGFREVELSCSS